MYYFGWYFCDTPRVLHSVLDLPQDQYESTPLIKVCEEGHLRVVRYLVQSGADVNKQTKVSFLSFFLYTIYAKVTSL